MKICLNVNYLLANILTYARKQNLEMYLLIVERFLVKQPMARLYGIETRVEWTFLMQLKKDKNNKIQKSPITPKKTIKSNKTIKTRMVFFF